MQIYIAEGTQQTGPFDLETVRQGLQSGRYSPGQLAWYEGAPGWEPISLLPGLEAVVPPAPPAPPPPPAPPLPPAMPAPGPWMQPPGTPPTPNPGNYAPPPGYAPPAGYTPPPPYTSPSASPPPKSFWSKLGGGVLGFLAILFFIVRVTRPFWSGYHTTSSHTYSSSTPTPSPSATVAFNRSTPSSTAPMASTLPSSAAPGFRTATYYNNANQFPTGELQQHYINFRFNYPNELSLTSGSKVSHKEDFVEVDHLLQGRSVETFYVEDFFTSEPSLAASLSSVAPKFFASMHEASKKANPALQLVSEGMTKFKGFAAYEYRSVLPTKDRAGNPFSVYSYYVIVAPPTGKNGVILEIVASSGTPGLRGIGDIGHNPEMSAILDSFTFL